MKLKVEGHPSLVRDSVSKAIINIDNSLLNEHKNKKRLQEKVVTLEKDVDDIKDSVNEIKLMLTELIKRV